MQVSAATLANKIPELSSRILDGTPVIAHGTKETTFRATYKDGGAIIHPKAGGDGSIIFATDHHNTPKHVDGLLRSHGLSEAERQRVFKELFDKEDSADINTGSVRITQWDVKRIEIGTAGTPMSHMVPLKIAYEFFALHLNTAIFHEGLHSIREALIGNYMPKDVQISEWNTGKHAPVHRLALQGLPHVSIHICLFGWRVFTVNLSKVSFGAQCFAYELDLVTGAQNRWPISPTFVQEKQLRMPKT